MAALPLLLTTVLTCSVRANRVELAISNHKNSQAALTEAGDCSVKPDCVSDTSKPIFFDMMHSNNAARVRLYIRLYVKDAVSICMVTYDDMRCPWFEEINPNQKVPALIIPNASASGSGEILYESNVIYEYMVDSYPTPSSPAVPFEHRDLSAIKRAKINLMCRVHDLYVASPNCNQPGCTHSQGALYLPPPGDETVDPTGGRRAIDALTRSRKITELWERWNWLEKFSRGLGNNVYLAGDYMSMADMTWFPTAVFMEFLLKHVAEWPTLFADYDGQKTVDLQSHDEIWNPGPVAPEMRKRFPKLTAWYPELLKIQEFRTVREQIMSFWLKEMHLDKQSYHENGRVKRFDPIKQAIANNPSLPWKPVLRNGTLEWP